MLCTSTAVNVIIFQFQFNLILKTCKFHFFFISTYLCKVISHKCSSGIETTDTSNGTGMIGGSCMYACCACFGWKYNNFLCREYGPFFLQTISHFYNEFLDCCGGALNRFDAVKFLRITRRCGTRAATAHSFAKLIESRMGPSCVSSRMKAMLSINQIEMNADQRRGQTKQTCSSALSVLP